MKTFSYDGGEAIAAAKISDEAYREYMMPFIDEYFYGFCVWYLDAQGIDLDISLRGTSMSIDGVIRWIKTNEKDGGLEFLISLTMLPSFDLVLHFISYCGRSIDLIKEEE